MSRAFDKTLDGFEQKINKIWRHAHQDLLEDLDANLESLKKRFESLPPLPSQSASSGTSYPEPDLDALKHSLAKLSRDMFPTHKVRPKPGEVIDVDVEASHQSVAVQQPLPSRSSSSWKRIPRKDIKENITVNSD